MFDKSYSKYYDIFNSDKPYEKEIKFVYKWANKPTSIIDIGCGTGNYWHFFPEKTPNGESVQICGIEKSTQMARIADLRGHVSCIDITKQKIKGNFDCATALFDVLNYMPNLDWFKNIPIKKGGYFIFDIWDKDKIGAQGFRRTSKMVADVFRLITPEPLNAKGTIGLKIEVWHGEKYFKEDHIMYLHTHEDIVEACGKYFDIVSIKPTKRWQTWYRLIKR